MTLLDIGCGWGATMKRAIEKYDVNVIGLTLSKNQHAYCEKLLSEVDTTRSHQVLLHGWEEFQRPRRPDRRPSKPSSTSDSSATTTSSTTAFDIMPEDGG